MHMHASAYAPVRCQTYEPMLTYRQLGPKERISIEIYLTFLSFH